MTDRERALDARLMEHAQHAVVAIPGMHRVQVAVDCECGTTVEACDDEELLDELLEHIAGAHETDPRVMPADMVAEAYPA